MNCSKAQRDLLLSASGELGASGLARLDAHVAACAACREYQSSLRAVTALAADRLPSGAPSAAVMARIRAAAQERVSRPPLIFRLIGAPLAPFGQPVRRLAYAAALLALVGGGGLMVQPGHRTQRIRECSAILRVVTEGAVHQAQTASPRETASDLRGLAQQLLDMQELSGDFSDEEMTSLDAAPPATVPLSHSSVALRAKRCV